MEMYNLTQICTPPLLCKNCSLKQTPVIFGKCKGDDRNSISSIFLKIFLIVIIGMIVSGIGNAEEVKVARGFGQMLLSPKNSVSYYDDTAERKSSTLYHKTNRNKAQFHEPPPKSTVNKGLKSSKRIFLFSEQDKSQSKFPIPREINKGDNFKDGVQRVRRQILPLPAKSTRQCETFNPEVDRLIKRYTTFLIDYASMQEWRSAEVVVPHHTDCNVCNYFTRNPLLSNVSLILHCVNGSDSIRNKKSLENNQRLPIVVADFIQLRSKRFRNKANSSINLHGIFNYIEGGRSVVLLAGNGSFTEILNTTRQPKTLKNYKWTLVKPIENARNKAEGLLQIYDIYGFAASLTPLPHMIGTWNETRDLRIIDRNIGNFQGHIIRITTVPGPPVVNLDSTAQLTLTSSSSLKISGYLPELLEIISFVLNFKAVVLTPSDGKFGIADEDGKWSGMVGMLQRNEADIALMSFSYTKSRKKVMDFSPPVEYSSTRLLIRRDWQVADLKWDAFIRPFKWEVWCTILVLIGIGTITLIIFSNFRLFETSPGESIWLLSTCFLLQDYFLLEGQNEHSTIRVTPFRILSGTFWILSVFVFACYTARLTSFLAADTDKLPLRDLSEAVRSRSWKIGLVRGSSFLEKVKESSASEMTRLWKNLQADPSTLVGGFPEGISNVYQKRFIFFTSDLIPTYLVKGNCSYAWLPGKYFPGFGYIGYQKNLPYAASISKVLTRIREVGLMRRTIKKWWGASATCSGRQTSDSFAAISLHESGSAFLALAIGASLALLFAAVEFAFHSKQHFWKLKNEKNHAFSPNEFAAPVVHGTVHLIPTLLKNDRPFIWNLEEHENKIITPYEKMYIVKTVSENR